MSEWNYVYRRRERVEPEQVAKAVSLVLMAVGLGALAFKGVQTYFHPGAPVAPVRPAAAAVTSTHDHARVSFVTADNAFHVPFPADAAPSLLVARKELYALVNGELRSAPLAELLVGKAELVSLMPPGRRVGTKVVLGPLRHMAWDEKQGRLYCMDEAGAAASYEPATAAWTLTAAPASPTRAYGAIAVQAGHVYAIESGGSQIWELGTPAPYLHRPFTGAAATPPVALAPMGLGRLLALDAHGTIRTARRQEPAGMIPVAPMADLGHGAARPAQWVDLDVKTGSKVAFAADGANGRIVALMPDSGRVTREFIVLPPAGEALGLKAIAIADEKLLAVVGGTLVAYPKNGAFHEESITDTTCPPELPALFSAAPKHQ